MQMEPHDAVEKLRLTLKVLGSLKSYFFEYKSELAAQLGEGLRLCVLPEGDWLVLSHLCHLCRLWYIQTLLWMRWQCVWLTEAAEPLPRC